tara:strand:+ start:631 stop:906 length:276 start_codon:yes stop_codon:yes gene_type:complete
MVNSIQNTNGFQSIKNEQTSHNKPAEKAEQIVASDDHVALKIKTLLEDIQTASEINHSRVEFLKNELANGQYKVNSLVIAENLVNEFKNMS